VLTGGVLFGFGDWVSGFLVSVPNMFGKVTGQGTNTCVRSLALFQNIFLMTMMQPGGCYAY